MAHSKEGLALVLRQNIGLINFPNRLRPVFDIFRDRPQRLDVLFSQLQFAQALLGEGIKALNFGAPEAWFLAVTVDGPKIILCQPFGLYSNK